MIHSLRQRHRLVMCALSLALPAAFVAGIAKQRPIPETISIPAEAAVYGGDFGRVFWNRADLFQGQDIIGTLRGNANRGIAVELTGNGLTRPDVLVYWSPGTGATADRLPGEAQLLGALASRTPLPIPATQQGASGRLVLYSLADQEIVAVSQTFSLRPD